MNAAYGLGACADPLCAFCPYECLSGRTVKICNATIAESVEALTFHGADCGPTPDPTDKHTGGNTERVAHYTNITQNLCNRQGLASMY